MTQPLIGITTSRTLNRQKHATLSLPEAYVQALSQAGATPLLIPLGLPEGALLDLLERLDGVLFSGGGDVEPQRYGSGLLPLVREVDPDRDRLEILLVQETLQRELPILGICRGIQVVNVALGGTLYEDIASQHPGALKHDYYPNWRRDHLAHEVQVDPSSRLHQALGSAKLKVNSLHHQAVRQLAPGLEATAFAPDGVIEAFELPGPVFRLAVQWHPECLPESPAMRALFDHFMRAAQAHHPA